MIQGTNSFRNLDPLETPTYSALMDLGVIVDIAVDVSDKYGIGFILSDQSIGVNFNDNTSIVQPSREKSKVIYLETSPVDKVKRESHFDLYKPEDHLYKKCMIYR
jgi:hypothetical protein